MIYGTYRTKTYIAGAWDQDKDAIEQIYTWKKSKYWQLDFVDAHSVTQARDSSLNCSIKASLKARMDISKTFVLVVGSETCHVRAGGCQYCPSYDSTRVRCNRNHSVDYRSFIEYECEKAVEAGIRIVVLYNSTTINKRYCPDCLKEKGIHLPMKTMMGDWRYDAIKQAIM